MTLYRFTLDWFGRAPPPPPPPPNASPTPPSDMTAQQQGGIAAASVGTPAPDPAERVETAVLPREPPADLTETRALVEALPVLQKAASVSLDDLVASGLLPDDARGEKVERLEEHLRTAESNPVDRGAQLLALDAGKAFAKILEERGPHLVRGLVVLAKARADAEAREPQPQILQRVSRYFGQPALLAPMVTDEPPWPLIDGTADSVKSFAGRYETWKHGLKRDRKRNWPAASEMWKAWRKRIETYLLKTGSPPEGPDDFYPDIVAAAAGKLPGRLFRLPLSRMDRLDWSDAALVTLPREKGAAHPAESEVPRWLLFAALTALGFDRRFLHRLMKADQGRSAAKMPEDDRMFILRLIEKAPDSGPAVLETCVDNPRPKEPAEIYRGVPTLSVGRSVAHDYLYGLRWLKEHGAFLGEADEDEG